MDRSPRATNPDNYNENGTIKYGKKQWVFSTQYRALKAELAELQRVLATTRKRSHGKLANEILKLGTNIKTKKLSYEAFQRTFGKSVLRRAPGLFMVMLRRKAENAGGQIIEFPTQITKLSEICHCGEVKKKPLLQRQHICAMKL
jgi:putative transposase